MASKLTQEQRVVLSRCARSEGALRSEFYGPDRRRLDGLVHRSLALIKNARAGGVDLYLATEAGRLALAESRGGE